jgi:ankyrin repeat protein
MHMASTHCNQAIFWLFLSRLQQDMDQADCHGDTVLIWIIKSSADLEKQYECAKLMLAHTKSIGARAEQVLNNQHNPL